MEKAIEEIKKLIEDQGRRISKLEAAIANVKDKKIGRKKESIKEFILLKKPTDENLKTLCIGYYLEKYEGLPFFNAKDLTNSFRQAKETKPGNINDRVNQNIAKGLMMETGEKKGKHKAWVLTSSGERFVENGFKKY